MNGLVAFLIAATLVCSAVNAGPFFPYLRSPLQNYYYRSAVAPLAAPAALPAAGVLGDYYSYATASALGYPYGSLYGAGYPYYGAYTGAYAGYPYFKK